MVKIIALLTATFICGFVIFLAEINHKPIKYDCRMATYPTAVDVPIDVIEQCRKLKEK
jgi:hypothetical protein